jgi:hypothetical protein
VDKELRNGRNRSKGMSKEEERWGGKGNRREEDTEICVECDAKSNCRGVTGGTANRSGERGTGLDKCKETKAY